MGIAARHTAEARYADFHGADLRRTHMTGCDFGYANLTGADLRDADLTDVTAGELVGCTFEGHANVQRWLGNMKQLSAWPAINEVLYGFAGSLKGQSFERV